MAIIHFNNVGINIEKDGRSSAARVVNNIGRNEINNFTFKHHIVVVTQ